MTRILSGQLSVYDYGTYSQVILLTTTISSFTIMGMMDGVNFFFCKEPDENKRNSYVSTIFFLQYVISAIVSVIMLSCTVPISMKFFENPDLKKLMIFVAVLPVLQNTISLLQIMFIAIGKAKLIALRNLIVSILKLCAIMLACYVFNNIAVILLCQVITDLAQVIYFIISLRKKNCRIQVFRFKKSLIKEILVYCVPMAMFTVVKTLNRESAKFVISYFTDPESVAVFSNASKLLPFDIIMTSFCTVLLPYITRYIANKEYEKTQTLYKAFLELSYITTSILAVGAICVAPQLITLLYTEKYIAYDFSVPVFIIYTIVDILNVLNITLILSAAGKTKTIMYASIGSFVANIVLNISLFFAFQEVGTALATLIVTLMQGIVILSFSAKEVKSNIFKFFDWKYLIFFLAQIVCFSALSVLLRNFLSAKGVHYFIIIVLVFGAFAGVTALINLRRLLRNLNTINQSKIQK